MAIPTILFLPFLIIGFLVTILALFELISFIINRYFLSNAVAEGIKKGTLMDPAFGMPDSYESENSWYKQYCKEAKDIFSTFKWQPLGLWSAPRYHGTYINIDKYNLRRTTSDRKQNLVNPKLKIYFFGGSTIWGWGARDEYTIPSRLLAIRSDVIIENHSQLGYVSSQEVIAFIQSLKNASKPDVIIFLDGLNDMYSAFQSGIAGIEQNADARKQKFESSTVELNEFLKEKSNLFKFIKTNFCRTSKNMILKKINYEKFARSIIDSYNQNVELVSKIALAYDIKPIFIWQPTIFDKRNLSKYEDKVLEVVSFWKQLHTSVKTIIQNEGCLNQCVFDMSDIFADEREPIYVDPWHYNERANDLIAKKISEFILE